MVPIQSNFPFHPSFYFLQAALNDDDDDLSMSRYYIYQACSKA